MSMVCAVYNLIRGVGLVNDYQNSAMNNAQAMGALAFGASKNASQSMDNMQALQAQEKQLLLDKQNAELMANFYQPFTASCEELAHKNLKAAGHINWGGHLDTSA